MKEPSIYDILTSEENFDNVMLADENGMETEFEQLATMYLSDGKLYSLLSPLKNGKPTDDGYLFRLDENNLDLIELVSDDAIVDEAIAFYEKMCAEE